MTKLRWSLLHVFRKTFLVSVLAQCIFGLGAMQDVKQDFLASTHAGRDSFSTNLDGTDRGRSMVSYLTLEEMGINKMGAESFDNNNVYDIIEYDNQGTREFLSNAPGIEKRPNVKLIPRIGRSKRSLSEKQQLDGKIPNLNDENMSEKDAVKSDWSEEDDRDYLFRSDKRRPCSRVVFIPRIGKKDYGGTNNRENKRAVFIPRIGKKDYEGTNNRENKRVVFIPRVGRGSFVSDVYRFSPQNRLKNRAVFIPRIG